MSEQPLKLDRKMIEQAINEIDGSMKAVVDRYGPRAAMLGLHMGVFLMMIERINANRDAQNIEKILDVLREQEIQVIWGLCELLEVKSDEVSQISKSLQDHMRIVSADVGESIGIDSVFLIPNLFFKGGKRGTGPENQDT